MTRSAQTITVREHIGAGGCWVRFPAEATATLAIAECACQVKLATLVRPWEVTSDVVDAMLRAAGWDPAHDLCPECQLDDRDDAVMRGQRTDGCPACARRCR